MNYTVGSTPEAYNPDNIKSQLANSYAGLTADQQAHPNIGGGSVDAFHANVTKEQGAYANTGPINPDVAIGNLVSRHATTPAPATPGSPAAGADLNTGIKRPILDISNPGGDSFYKNPEPVDYEAIRKQEMDKAQAMIDATQGLYDQQMLEIRRRGQSALQQSQSIGVGAGLAGSPFAAAQDAPVIAATAREAAAETARRQAQIAELMGKGDAAATARFKDLRDQASKDRTDYVNEQKTNQATFQATLAQAAQQGINYSDFTPEQKATAKQRSGLDDFALNVYMNANKKKTEQKDISYQTVGNKIIGHYTEFDANGKPTIKTFESDSIPGLVPNTKYSTQTNSQGQIVLIPDNIDPNKPLDQQIKIYGNAGDFTPKTDTVQQKNYAAYVADEKKAGREPLGINDWMNQGKAPKVTGSDKTGRFAYNPKTGKYDLPVTAPVVAKGKGGSGGTGKKTVGQIKKEDVGKVANQLKSRAGADGYISPEDYKKGKAAWVGAGYSSNDYDTQFNGFVNPSHAGDYSLKLKSPADQNPWG
jgi:hypothetical protein